MMRLNLSPDILDEVLSFRKKYIAERVIYIPGSDLLRILKSLGAREEDVQPLQNLSSRLPADPTLPFRRSKNGRFIYDKKNASIHRGEFQPFVLSTEEDFKRFDSGKIRHFAEIEDDLQKNTVFQSLLTFKMLIVDGVKTSERKFLDYNSDEWVCTLFNLRTVTTPELTGEPALEGVHCDGVDHTMTTFLGSENMTDDSAITSIHDMAEESGTAWKDAQSKFVLKQFQHKKFLDTVLIADNERKHSLSPVKAMDVSKNSTRDMLIFFTRRPAKDGHVSYAYDSRKKHSKLPMEIKIISDEVTKTISWEDFKKIDLRIGTIVSAVKNEKARRPAYVLTVDLGEMGIKTSSAQITDHYTPEALIGKQVLCVCNFPVKRVAGVKSEILVTGVYDKQGKVVLPTCDLPVPDGSILS